MPASRPDAEIRLQQRRVPLTSRELLGNRREVRIEHEGSEYVLRATRNGKLILTK
jgi:hemin uptake protein HemP